MAAALYSSTFLPIFPSKKYSNVSLINTEREPHKQEFALKITAGASIPTNFGPITKLINDIQKKLIVVKNPSSSQIIPIENKRKQVNIILANFFRSVDVRISNFLDLPFLPHIDPEHTLSGNFAPVGELAPTVCEVVDGSLPQCLDGVYIRNGPNPQFIPHGPYHNLDGDGMLHAIKIHRRKATFCSRYVKTYKYEVERGFGFPIVPSVFSSLNNGLMASWARYGLSALRMLTGQFDPIGNGFGVANEGLVFFGGRLYALWEADLPYEIKLTSDGDLITVGRSEEFRNSHTLRPFPYCMTAHPKIDPDTGELFSFCYNIFLSPQLIFLRFKPNVDGGIQHKEEVPIFSLKQLSFVHDFFITKNFGIFLDSQILLDIMELIKGRTILTVDTDKTSRLGFVPRDAKSESEMWWVHVPGLNILHAMNGWEEDDGETIVMVAFNVLDVEHVAEHTHFLHMSLERITVNSKSKVVERQTLSSKNLEFGAINQAYIGKKNKYVYAAVVEMGAGAAPMPRTEGVVKVDVSLSQEDRVVASRMYGPECFGGEPMFVAKDGASEEDDGYLVSYVHDEKTGESTFLVMDAKSPTLEIVAAVKLPQRVPYGFHGLFVPQKKLNK